MSQRTEPEREPETVGLSVTQIMASALAAVTTTWALSYLGVAGTVIGAGLASVVTVLGNHLYAQSIERTRAQVRAYRPSRYAAAAQAADIIPTVTLDVDDATQPVPAVTADEPATRDGAPDRDELEPEHGRPSRRPLVVAIVVVFLLIMAAVTAFEIINGRTLSDTVRGTQGSGTTIFGGTGPTTPVTTPAGTSTATSTPTPTDTTPATSTSTTVASTSTSAPGTETSTTPPPVVTQSSTPPTVSATP